MYNLPIGREVDAVDLLQMTLQKHDTATSPQVPDTTKRIQTTADLRQKEIDMLYGCEVKVVRLRGMFMFETTTKWGRNVGTQHSCQGPHT